MQKQQPSGEVPRVSVSASQGVVVGSGNIQNNNWAPKPPLDPVVLSGRNPHTAVALLRQVPHDELVDFFIRASPGDVSEILDVFVDVDLDKLIATLGDLNRRKAAELIDAIDPDEYPAGLDEVPVAAEEIARKAAGLGWADPEPLDGFQEGYARKYQNGRVFWSGQFGTRTTVGAIDDCIEDDEEHNPWDFPVGDQEPAIPSPAPFETEGVCQQFKRGMVYSSEYGTFLIFSDSHYENTGGSGGWLGFPIGEVEDRPDGYVQNFEGGMIYARGGSRGDSGLRRVYEVRREVISVLPDQDWRPISQETTTVSSYGWRGTVQHFEVQLVSGTCEVAVYSPKQWQFGPMTVMPGVWDYYSKMGAETSWLGFPNHHSGIGRWSATAGADYFEGGVIYWRVGSDPIAVRKAVADLAGQDWGWRSRLGFPVTEEASADSGESDSIQFFENGVVTLRDGEYEVWLRPPGARPGAGPS
jgi:hypothetical protein